MNKRYPVTMMCAACIPWTKEFKFDEKNFRRQVANLIKHDAKSIYIMGTAGEGYSLDTRMFTEIVKVFLDECGKGEEIMPMVGIISTSLPEMMDRIKIASESGCRDFQIALPCWGALNESEVTRFFQIVCGAFPDCRFICYNNGPRSKTKVSVRQFVQLSKEVPNLAAVKYSTPNIDEIHEIATADCPLTFYLVDSGFTFGAMLGKVGLLNSYASTDFDLSWMYFNAGVNRDYETMITLGNYLIELANCFNCVEANIMDSALDKSIERIADPGFSNTLYPPYQGLPEDQYLKVEAGFRAVVKKYRNLYKLH